MAADFNYTFLALWLRVCFVPEKLSHYSGLPKMLTIWRAQVDVPAVNLCLRMSDQYPKMFSPKLRPWKVRSLCLATTLQSKEIAGHHIFTILA